MKTIAHDAQRMGLLFEYGIVTGKEVVAWADSAIVQLASLPDSLLQLSLTAPDNTADIISHLHRLASGADFWAALRSVIPRIRDYVVEHPDGAETTANHLFLTACFAHNKFPKDLQFLFRFDDAFSLAQDGVYGTPQDVYRDFVQELGKFDGERRQ